METKRFLKVLFIVIAAVVFMYASAAIPMTYRQVENVCAMSRVIGDVNGDGKGDLVAIGGIYDAQSIKVFAWYDVTPTSFIKHPINNTQLDNMGYNGDADLADLDNDGDLDIITIDTKKGVAGYVKIFINPGNLGSNPNAVWPVQVAHTVAGVWEMKDVEVADFDKDGKLDILMCDNARGDPNYATMYVLYQNAINSWQIVSYRKTQTEGLAVGDMNGDGRVDAVIGGAYYRNPGGRSASWAFVGIDNQWYGHAIGWPSDCTMADSQ
ncbi:FG-GAP repeat domain-containing protein [Spirochaetota bacterium]